MVAETAVIITRYRPVAVAMATFILIVTRKTTKKAPGGTPTVATKNANMIDMEDNLIITRVVN